MKQKILLSSIAGIKDFAGATAAHAVEMKSWREREAKVKAQDGKKGIPAIERWVSCPRPKSHPLVESAVNENGESDFEIVDDGPTAEQKLTERKMELLGQVSSAERDAINALLPIGKHRLYHMRETDILAAELDARQKPGFIAKLIGKTARDPSEDRTSEDAKFMADQKARRDRAESIGRAAAQTMSDIEDLTIDTIDAWKCPSF